MRPVFYKRERVVCHAIDRRVRWAEGAEVSDEERDALPDTYHAVWHSRWRSPSVLYCDGEGGLNNEVAKERLAALGTELRMRAPGQHATTIEARRGSFV